MSRAERMAEPRFYRLINRSCSQTQHASETQSPQKLTESIIRNHNFVYIDINQQNGLCQMERINPEEADQDAELLLGENYLCAINKLPMESQKAIDYLYKARQFSKRKEKFKSLLKEQLQATVLKNKIKQKKKEKNLQKDNHIISINSSINKRQFRSSAKLKNSHEQQMEIGKNWNNHKLISEMMKSKDKDNIIMYRGMQTKYLREYLQKKQLDEINSKILQREKILIQKYGFTNNFESVSKLKSPIIRKNRKIILPEIKSVPNFVY